MCEDLAIMYRGRFVEFGNKQDIYTNPQHIYTKRLLSAIPTMDPIARDAHKANRLAVEKEYADNQEKYYDENGRVYDLTTLSDSHKVAIRPSDIKGGA